MDLDKATSMRYPISFDQEGIYTNVSTMDGSLLFLRLFRLDRRPPLSMSHIPFHKKQLSYGRNITIVSSSSFMKDPAPTFLRDVSKGWPNS